MKATQVIARYVGLKRGLALLLAGTALVSAAPAQAQDCQLIDGILPEDCEQANAGAVVRMPWERNAERDGQAAADLAEKGFSITFDDPVVRKSPDGPRQERQQDIRLDRADIQVKYDGLYGQRRLNVLTDDLRSTFQAGETVEFRSSMNYPGSVTRAELRIIEQSTGFGLSPVTVVPTQPNGTARWVMPDDGADGYSFILRVYDEKGRYDETAPLPIQRVDEPVRDDLNGPVIAAGEGEDRTARRTIPSNGGMVTVAGSGLPANARVLVMGRTVPVDEDGRFVTERQMPFGEHNVVVSLSAPGQAGYTLEREVLIPRSDWFYTGLADFTLSRRDTGDGAETETEGRLAFYAKGNVNGTYRVTAAADTGERGVDVLFDDFFDKSPESVIDRLDPDDLYPTYGDDSTIVEDAPTSGRLYLKVEHGDSHLMWGDFRNRIEGTSYLNNTRNLYGGQLLYQSPATTDQGDRRMIASAYAAQPDSLPQRDELRGTGGSAYFLKRQDILPGTETLRIETVDPTSGRVINSRQLVAGEDYRIDYIQGTVILTEPLSSSSRGGAVVSGGVSGSYDVNLVAQYEYEPTLRDIDGTSFGGRIEAWLPGDRVRLGFSAMDETTDSADLKVYGADVRLRFGENSHLDAEIAESEGTGFGKSVSTDGGLTFNGIPATGSSTSAQAVRVEGQLDLADVWANGEGMITAFYEKKDEGFNTLSEDVTADQRSFGVAANVVLGSRTDLRLKYTDFEEDGGEELREGTVDLAYALSEDVTVEVGLRHLDSFQPGDPDDTGRRTDLGVRVTREFSADNAIWAFAQRTVDRSGGLQRNDRVGVGGRLAFSDKLSAEGEVSDGTLGFGARALLTYRPDAGGRYYAGYELEPDREISGHTLNGRDKGNFILGAEHRISPTTTYYAENNYDLYGQRRSLTSAYGVTYTPNSTWKFSGAIEAGQVRDDIDGDFERTALSFGMNYDDGNGITGRLRAEARVEDHETDPSRDRETYIFAGSYGYQVNPDWRFLASADALISDSDQSSFLDGRYVEASLGFAYRPIDNDRLNALLRYTYLYDQPGVDQVSADGTTAGEKQRSHIFSLDAIYEVNEHWELGGKLAYRVSETAPRSGGAFVDNSAGLAALRATWHVVHKWDVSGEVRALVLPSADAREYGLVASAYRHINNNVKLGVGYNFGRFSDDLRDMSMDDEGLFVNVVAKF